jgi:3-phenylpropionate/trans-cinnamate dioxygenase ferredoxin subunit
MGSAASRRGSRKVVVGTADAIPDGGRLIVNVDGHSIGVFRLGGEYYALLNRCPHQGGPLCQGAIRHAITASAPGQPQLDSGVHLLECPWHGWEFDLRTGQSYVDPVKKRVRPYPVDVESGQALAARVEEEERCGTARRARGPHRAETIPISVEENYIVLDLAGQ